MLRNDTFWTSLQRVNCALYIIILDVEFNTGSVIEYLPDLYMQYLIANFKASLKLCFCFFQLENLKNQNKIHSETELHH